MQFDLLGDALKKIPKEPKLVNARFNVAIQVGFVDFWNGSWKAKKRFMLDCFDCWTNPLRTEISSFPISNSSYLIFLPTTFPISFIELSVVRSFSRALSRHSHSHESLLSETSSNRSQRTDCSGLSASAACSYLFRHFFQLI